MLYNTRCCWFTSCLLCKSFVIGNANVYAFNILGRKRIESAFAPTAMLRRMVSCKSRLGYTSSGRREITCKWRFNFSNVASTRIALLISSLIQDTFKDDVNKVQQLSSSHSIHQPNRKASPRRTSSSKSLKSRSPTTTRPSRIWAWVGTRKMIWAKCFIGARTFSYLVCFAHICKRSTCKQLELLPLQAIHMELINNIEPCSMFFWRT